jgi:hypothetical protein
MKRDSLVVVRPRDLASSRRAGGGGVEVEVEMERVDWKVKEKERKSR